MPFVFPKAKIPLGASERTHHTCKALLCQSHATSAHLPLYPNACPYDDDGPCQKITVTYSPREFLQGRYWHSFVIYISEVTNNGSVGICISPVAILNFQPRTCNSSRRAARTTKIHWNRQNRDSSHINIKKLGLWIPLTNLNLATCMSSGSLLACTRSRSWWFCNVRQHYLRTLKVCREKAVSSEDVEVE